MAAGAYADDTSSEVLWRSKREGRADWRPRVAMTGERSPMNWLLMLSRLVRCRLLAGRTADDAVLILEIDSIHDRLAVI